MFVDVYLWPVPAGNANDPWLRDPTQPASATTLPRDDKPARRKIKLPQRGKIVAVSLMNDLVARYGQVEGTRIYWEMYDQHKGPFGRGKKYDTAPRLLRKLRKVN